jgi:hypothetical protein
MMIGFGVVGALAIFCCLVWLAKEMKGISIAQIACLLVAFAVCLFMIGGQVKVTTSLSSGEADSNNQ